MDKKIKIGLIVLAILIGIILVWGFVGGLEADKVGISCDIGLGNSLCWKWHKNVVGELQEFLDDLQTKK
jgi:hypothetical protein